MTEQARLQDRHVGSQNEANVAAALDRLGMEYDYQRPFGMLGVRGSQVIDFLVFTVPLPTPLFVHGRYWHTGKRAAEDQIKLAEITSQMRGHWAEPVIVWDDETETIEDAVDAIRKVLII